MPLDIVPVSRRVFRKFVQYVDKHLGTGSISRPVERECFSGKPSTPAFLPQWPLKHKKHDNFMQHAHEIAACLDDDGSYNGARTPYEIIGEFRNEGQFFEPNPRAKVRAARSIKAAEVKRRKQQLEDEGAYAVQEQKGFAAVREEIERRKANGMDASL
jgi:hypothetical protein